MTKIVKIGQEHGDCTMIYLMYPMQDLSVVQAVCSIMVITLLFSLKGLLGQVRVTDDDGQHSSVSFRMIREDTQGCIKHYNGQWQ